MKCMLLIYGNDELWSSFSPEDMGTLVAETDALNRELASAGEAKEYLGSFNIIDCESLELALEIAARVPFARYGSVEVRPIMLELDELAGDLVGARHGYREAARRTTSIREQRYLEGRLARIADQVS